MKKVTLDIAGMRCGSCVIGLELMLARQKGIISAKVSLSDRTAVVEYDPEIVTLSDISKVVSDLGYIATARS
jgi:Cu2+-exporting ATPase